MRTTLFFSLIALLSTPPFASAQTTTTGIQAVNHFDGSSQTQPVTLIGSTVGSWFVNRGDCGLDTYSNSGNATIRLNVGTIITSATNSQLWVGTNCLSSTARAGGTAATCHQAVGGTVTGSSLLNGVLTLPIAALAMSAPDTTNASYDLCGSTTSRTLNYFVFPSNVTGDVASTSAIEFTLSGDVTAPNPVTISSDSGQGDRQITLSWTSSSDTESQSQTYYFSLKGGCASIGVTDAGTATDGGTPVAFVAGARPPVGDSSFLSGARGTGGTIELISGDIGLSNYGDSAAIGLAVRDVAGNYGVLSNIVCVTRIQTFGICGSAASGSADCPRGCAVSPVGAPAKAWIVLLGLAVLALVSRRRGARA